MISLIGCAKGLAYVGHHFDDAITYSNLINSIWQARVDTVKSSSLPDLQSYKARQKTYNLLNVSLLFLNMGKLLHAVDQKYAFFQFDKIEPFNTKGDLKVVGVIVATLIAALALAVLFNIGKTRAQNPQDHLPATADRSKTRVCYTAYGKKSFMNATQVLANVGLACLTAHKYLYAMNAVLEGYRLLKNSQDIGLFFTRKIKGQGAIQRVDLNALDQGRQGIVTLNDKIDYGFNCEFLSASTGNHTCDACSQNNADIIICDNGHTMHKACLVNRVYLHSDPSILQGTRARPYDLTGYKVTVDIDGAPSPTCPAQGCNSGLLGSDLRIAAWL